MGQKANQTVATVEQPPQRPGRKGIVQWDYNELRPDLKEVFMGYAVYFRLQLQDAPNTDHPNATKNINLINRMMHEIFLKFGSGDDMLRNGITWIADPETLKRHALPKNMTATLWYVNAFCV